MGIVQFTAYTEDVGICSKKGQFFNSRAVATCCDTVLLTVSSAMSSVSTNSVKMCVKSAQLES